MGLTWPSTRSHSGPRDSGRMPDSSVSGKCGDGTTMTVRRNASGTPVYRCRKTGHCCWPAERTDRYVENVIVARLSPREAAVDVAALRDELVVCDNRKRGAAQV